MNNTIVIYHGGCRDGFCSAWVYNKFRSANSIVNNVLDDSKIEYHPGYYGQEPPDVKDKNVVILDFCYPLEVMIEIVKHCKSLVWLDHHKTAEPFIKFLHEEMKPFSPILDRVKYDFDNSRSGAGIAWDYFFPNQPRPWLVDYVEDRDLWNKKLQYSDEINSFIACLEFNFDVWNQYESLTIGDAAISGKVAIMKTEQYVREVCKNVYFADIVHPQFKNQWDTPTHYKIPTVNICQVDCSEVLHELCSRHTLKPFAMYWFKRHDGMYQYGLRSIGDFDVSNVAKLFNGGGHRNASGFQLKYLLEELK